MNKKDLFNAIGGIDDELIEKSEEKKQGKKIYKIILPIAAGLCLIIVASVLVTHNFSMGVSKNEAACDTAEVEEFTEEIGESIPENAEETITEISQEETVTEVYSEATEVATEGAVPKSSRAYNPSNPDYDTEVCDGVTEVFTSSKQVQTTQEKTTKSIPETQKDITTTCNNSLPENTVMFNGVVREVNGSAIVVEKYERKAGQAYSSTSPIYPTGELYSMSTEGLESTKNVTFNVGDKVYVYYSGEVMETEPMQVNAFIIGKADFPTEE